MMELTSGNKLSRAGLEGEVRAYRWVRAKSFSFSDALFFAFSNAQHVSDGAI